MPDQELPIPTLDETDFSPTPADAALVHDILAGGLGKDVDKPGAALDQLANLVARHRVSEALPFAAAYAHTALTLGSASRKVGRLAAGATVHPHGNEPRMLVFKRELDALLDEFAQFDRTGDALGASEKLQDELAELHRCKRVAGSLAAVLLRATSDLALVTPADAVDVARATATALHNELDSATRALPAVGPINEGQQTLASSYYPVNVKPEQVQPGDVLLDREDGSLHYTSAQLSGAPGDLAALLASERYVILRPFGYTLTQVMRVEAVKAHLCEIATLTAAAAEKAETKLRSTLTGRTEGMTFAAELLAGPAWTLPPAVLAPAS